MEPQTADNPTPNQSNLSPAKEAEIKAVEALPTEEDEVEEPLTSQKPPTPSPGTPLADSAQKESPTSDEQPERIASEEAHPHSETPVEVEDSVEPADAETSKETSATEEEQTFETPAEQRTETPPPVVETSPEHTSSPKEEPKVQPETEKEPNQPSREPTPIDEPKEIIQEAESDEERVTHDLPNEDSPATAIGTDVEKPMELKGEEKEEKEEREVTKKILSAKPALKRLQVSPSKRGAAAIARSYGSPGGSRYDNISSPARKKTGASFKDLIEIDQSIRSRTDSPEERARQEQIMRQHQEMANMRRKRISKFESDMARLEEEERQEREEKQRQAEARRRERARQSAEEARKKRMQRYEENKVARQKSRDAIRRVRKIQGNGIPYHERVKMEDECRRKDEEETLRRMVEDRRRKSREARSDIPKFAGLVSDVEKSVEKRKELTAQEIKKQAEVVKQWGETPEHIYGIERERIQKVDARAIASKKLESRRAIKEGYTRRASPLRTRGNSPTKGSRLTPLIPGSDSETGSPTNSGKILKRRVSEIKGSGDVTDDIPGKKKTMSMPSALPDAPQAGRMVESRNDDREKKEIEEPKSSGSPKAATLPNLGETPKDEEEEKEEKQRKEEEEVL